MDNRILATEIYEFLKANDSVDHFEGIPSEDSIARIEEDLSDLHMVQETIRDIEDIADIIEDHEYYITDVKPLLKQLREIQGKLEAEQRRRMVSDTGYEVKHAIQMGDREILLAVNMKDPDGNFYMKAEYSENGIIAQYDRVRYSPSYLCIMEEFSVALDRQITAVRNELPNYAPTPITPEQCHPNDYCQSIDGKVVAIKAVALRPEYRRGDVQLVLVSGGAGSRANANGRAVYCYHLNDGKHTRYERHDVLGEIKVLPDWAKERLAMIRADREAEKQLDLTPLERVAGYEITERVQVGKKQFVLGENPNAVNPFVTWQHLEGRTGYDHGHYFDNRDKALADLNTRAENERELIASGRTPPPTDKGAR